MVLEIQWLRTLHPIVWDFSKLQMTFNQQGQEIVLIGLSKAATKFVDSKKLTKAMVKHKTRGAYAAVCPSKLLYK